MKYIGVLGLSAEITWSKWLFFFGVIVALFGVLLILQGFLIGALAIFAGGLLIGGGLGRLEAIRMFKKL